MFVLRSVVEAVVGAVIEGVAVLVMSVVGAIIAGIVGAITGRRVAVPQPRRGGLAGNTANNTTSAPASSTYS